MHGYQCKWREFIRPLLTDNPRLARNQLLGNSNSIIYTYTQINQSAATSSRCFHLNLILIHIHTLHLYHISNFQFGSYTKIVKFRRFNFVYGTSNAFKISRKFSNNTELWCLIEKEKINCKGSERGRRRNCAWTKVIKLFLSFNVLKAMNA